ncbi:hypothetical protein [Actinomyces radicidentis]|uniref:DUF4276 family protein n=1 Tax=Actinomyces radicidentis TaxID=111015 RepID=A0A0X8JG51_ACTRD|nr:hypothetical protein [Actinomyces radicidentis]AMD88225.1 hypothetical protein AXF14_12350 [Actinomyces radicidentis]
MTQAAPAVSVAVEGDSDTGMAEAVLRAVGLTLSRPVLVKHGVAKLDTLIPGLARTGPRSAWIVFRDADQACPVELHSKLIGARPHGAGFELRFACSMTEAWLLADGAGFASFFRVAPARLPRTPDSLPHAKHELIRLCQTSRSRSIRGAMARQDGSPGPLYVSTLNDFARTAWNVEDARDSSPSLSRSLERLVALRRELEHLT